MSHVQTAVEFALAASLLFNLMFGLMKLAFAAYSYNTVSHTTAPEWVRYAFVHLSGSVNPQTASVIEQRFKCTYMPGGAPLSAASCVPRGQRLSHAAGLSVQHLVQLCGQIPFFPSKTLPLNNT